MMVVRIMPGVDCDPACWAWPVAVVGTFGDDEEQRSALEDWQEGRCGVCPTGYAECLDHDHVTGLARGYLCRSCNFGECRSYSAADVFARWRACPATAVLGLRFIGGNGGRDWTGPTYLPGWAPLHHGWPHAYSKSAHVRVLTTADLAVAAALDAAHVEPDAAPEIEEGP
jgi:hypothetical protein